MVVRYLCAHFHGRRRQRQVQACLTTHLRLSCLCFMTNARSFVYHNCLFTAFIMTVKLVVRDVKIKKYLKVPALPNLVKLFPHLLGIH